MRWPTAFMLFAAPIAGGCMSSYMRDCEPTGPPGPGEVKVVIYRTSGLGGGITFPVYDGEKMVGFTEARRRFEYRCAPGRHVFLSWSENEKVIDAELEAGKTYYLRSFAKMGFVVAAAGFEPVTRDHEDWAEIEPIVGELKCREVIPEKAAEHEARRRERARRILKEHAEGKEDPRFLRPGDGK